MIVPGHADNSVTVHLGYGRSHGGKIATGAGFNANLLRTAATPWIATGLQIKKTGDTYAFATVQHQYAIDSRTPRAVARISPARPRSAATWCRSARSTISRRILTFAQNESNQVEYHGPSLYPRLQVRWLCLGHVHRPEPLHRLQRLRGGLPFRKQHCRGRQGSGDARGARCTGSASTPISAAASTIPKCTSSRCLACSAKTRRANTFARSAPPRTAPKV